MKYFVILGRSLYCFACPSDSNKGVLQLFCRNLFKLEICIERIQKRAMRIVFPDLKYREALTKVDITTLYSRRELLSKKLFNGIVNNKNHKVAELLPPTSSHKKFLRNTRRCNTPVCKTDRFKKSFITSHCM